MSLEKIKLRSIGLKPDPERVWMVAAHASQVCGPLLAEEVISLGRHGGIRAMRIWHVMRPEDVRDFAGIEADLKESLQGDKRQGCPRIPCDASVLLQLRNQVTVHGQSIDLAFNGMLLRTDRGILRVGTGLNLTASSDRFIGPFTTRGRVARKASDGIYGIEFLEPDDEAREVIDKFLSDATKRAAA
ncbi:MAG: PilZ domain-containing protein [Deltaproteobacteria bacterium]|nr:PilZ domain-containing protein [Deltaproteobacteria bacterium]